MIDVETIVSRLRDHFDSVGVGAPMGDHYRAQLQAALPSVPSDRLRFYEQCNGITVDMHDTVVGHIFSVTFVLS